MTGRLTVRFDSHGATLSWPGGPSLGGITAAVHYRMEGEPHTLCLVAPDQVASAGDLQATWRCEPAEDGADLWLEVANGGAADLQIETLDIFAVSSAEGGTCDLDGPPAQWSFYQNGYQSWTPAFARHMGDSLYTDPGTLDYRRKHLPHWEAGRGDRPTSEWVTVIVAPGPRARPQALMLGFVTTKDQLAEIQLDLQRGEFSALIARCHLDGITLPPGETLQSERLWVRAGPDPLALLEDWAERTGREMEARVPSEPPTGWCTWYYFYGQNKAGDALKNVAAISHHDLPLDVVLLDDGYQTAIGDWLSLNAKKFPQGMNPVTEAIRAAGLTPGIWTAPFATAADSRLFAEHPDWVLRDEENEPVVGWNHWGTDCYALDCSDPQVLDWLQYTFWRMRSEWGMVFFKIDFIFAAALPGRRRDPTATRAQALRRGVEAVRRGIGDDAFLLGCGAPLGPCVGLVDGMRVGPDVDPNWHPVWSHDLSAPSTENALRNSIARAPFHGRLWASDPDCLMVRRRGATLNLVLNEMRSLTALAALLGGMTLDSDHLPVIRPGRLKYLRQALPPTGVSARPLDLFENEMPRLLLLPVERDWGRWWVVGAINWADHTTETIVRTDELGLPRGRYHVYHYWRRRYLGVIDDGVTINRHQPHETAVLLFKPVAQRPDLLTTTFHVCQGATEVAECEWRAADNALRVELRKEGQQFGEVLFAVPQGWRAAEARVDGVKRPLVEIAAGVVGLGLTLEGRAEVEVGFEQV